MSGTAPRDRRRGLLGVALTLPGAAWLAVFFLVPLYVVVSISTGTVDPVFRSVVPAWNPADWRGDQFGYVLSRLTGPDGFFGPVMVRTVVYVLLAVAGCLVVAYPVAWFVARHSGRRRGLVLALIVAPFWISYMMRMLAWVNLLADDGLVNRLLGGAGLVADPVTFLSGRPTTVVLGLVYGYVPYMILPMYAALDRISPALLEAARDLGAGRFETFRRVVLPMSVPGVLAGLVLVALPMTGDYFTNDLLSASPSTAMLGNLINTSVANPSQAGQAGALVLILVLAMAAPMLLYVRSSVRSDLAS
ncbi:ABC transporter permease [Kineosporia sp. R_H_3]|uniref:ABC transporter permease n=1 Tax=Kineosporia sp. R_H_3 TaxID=1961848 RepID=UPI0018E9FFFD|nr:ABC transporter permease [Kineosporia sp. R_H_3]